MLAQDLNPVNGRHHPDEEIEADLVTDLKTRFERLRTDARHSRLAIGFIRKGVMHVVRQLTMDADRLHALQHTVSGSLQHRTLY